MSSSSLTVKFGTLDDHDLPEIVYKYRDWSDINHKRFISEREVFLASPSSFEDDLDCQSPTRFDLLSQEQIYEYYHSHSFKDFPNLTRQQRRKHARDWTKNAPFKNKTFLDQWNDNYRKEYNNREGILSLTANWNNNEMWKIYANKYQGFCIGYNTRVMFPHLGGGGDVKYVEKLPPILPAPFMTFEEALFIRAYHKTEKWSFEEEYRTKKFWPQPASIEDRQIKIPIEAYKVIIIGDKMPSNQIAELKEKVKKHIGNIPVLTRGEYLKYNFG